MKIKNLQPVGFRDLSQSLIQNSRFLLEKGADFSGESVLQREFDLVGEVNQVKVQLAFSTNELRQRTTALLLLETENK